MLRRVCLPLTAAVGSQLRFCLNVVVPTLSESISEGTVAEVLKPVGSTVAEDEVICRIESEKATVDVNAPKAGVLTSVPTAGAVVKVGSTVATIKEGAVGTAAPAAAKSAAPAAAAAATKAAEAPKKEAAAAVAAAPIANVSVPPAVRKVVIAGAETRVRQERISAMRRRIAERLKASQNTAAMLTTFNEIDMTNLMALREKHKDEFLKRHGVKMGFMSPFAKACATALQEVPIVNASWCDDYIEHHDFVDISIAVATKTGLVVPVLRDVQDMTFADIEKKIEDYGVRAKANKLSLEEMTGSTFTISNGGTFGS